jgi:hypothetical protein
LGGETPPLRITSTSVGRPAIGQPQAAGGAKPFLPRDSLALVARGMGRAPLSREIHGLREDRLAARS